MSLTGTRKDPFLLPDSLPLNTIKRVQALTHTPRPILCHFLFFFLNLLEFLLNSSLLVAEKKSCVSVKY